MNKITRSLPVLAAISISGLLAQTTATTGTRTHTPPTAEAMAARHVEGMAKRLTLTDAQKESAKSVYTAAGKSTEAFHAPMKSAHDALTAAMKANDTVGIDRASLQIGTLMAQEMSVQSKADAAFRQTLTADQQTKFDQMHTRGGGPGGPRGPGGPGGPRPEGHRPPPPPPAAQ